MRSQSPQANLKFFNSFLKPLIILIVSAGFVSPQDIISFATPSEELNRIQENCEAKGIRGFKGTRVIICSISITLLGRI